MKAIKYTLLLLATVISVKSQAQTSTDEVGELYLKSQAHQRLEVAIPDTSDFNSFLFEYDSSKYHLYTDEIQYAKSVNYKRDLGFNLTSRYSRNFGDGLNDETQNFTSERFSVGVNWNLLSEGLRDNRVKSEIARNEWKIEKINERSMLKERAYGYRYNTIIYYFNKERIALLGKRIPYLVKQESAFESLHHQRLIPFTEVIKVRRKRAKYELLLKDYQEYNRAFEQTNPDFNPDQSFAFPLLDLAMDSLVMASANQFESDQLLTLRNQNVLLKNRLQEDIRLQLFARRNYTSDTENRFNRNFNTVGVSLSVPLARIYNSRKQIVDYKLKNNESDSEYDSYHRSKELMNHCFEYQYKLQQYQQLEYEGALIDEQIRKEKITNQDAGHQASYLNAFSTIQYRAEIDLELIGLKSQLYLKLLKIQALSEVENFNAFLAEIPELKSTKFIGERWVKIAEDFKHDRDFLEQYLIENELQVMQKETSMDQYLIVDPTDFNDRHDMEAYVRERLSEMPSTKVCISDLEALIRLDEKTIKMNH